MSQTKFPHLKIGFLGHGKMFEALSKGFVKAGLVKAENITASNLHQNDREVTSVDGFKLINSNSEVVKRSDVVVIAVKPHVVAPVLKEVKGLVEGRHLVISIAAGVTIQRLQEMLPDETRLFRVMPNTPALVGCGASVCSGGTYAKREDEQLVEQLFTSVGLCEKMPEKYLDAVNGVSGSGPAFAFLAVEALSDGGVKMGLPRDKATKLAAQMLMGAAKMVLDTGKHPGELKDAVCSPGGTTIAGVHALEKSGFRCALMNAVEAATIRAGELGKLS